MFCPKCGQHQVSEDVCFCCACGAKLGTENDASTKRIIAMVMHIALTALAISGWGPWSGPMYNQIRALIVLVSVITFLLLFSSDLKRAFSKLFCQEKDQSDQETSWSSSASSTVNQLSSAPHQSAFPPVSSVPVNSLVQRGKNTREMIRPPSITEDTTELLDKD
jgi:hypothetical protein